MVDQARIGLFHEAINFALEILNFSNFTLKEKQYEVLKLLVVEKKDVLAVLPTGYGKSLIYQLLRPVCNFMNCGGRSNAQHSSVLVISPLNALIQDQILKMRKGALNVCVLEGDRLTGDDDHEEVKLNAPVESWLSTTYVLIFTHLEVVLDNKNVFKLLKCI